MVKLSDTEIQQTVLENETNKKWNIFVLNNTKKFKTAINTLL